ncbi:MAG TPA: type I pullulanase [Chloroflexota bacterium]|nr:type I pullulanase [Chloroflexota bacterium]
MTRRSLSGRVAASCLTLALALTGLVAGGGLPALPAGADTTTEIIVHYFRPAADYNGWNVWLWPNKPASAAGAEYDFTGSDAFGKVVDAHLPGADTEVGIIVRLNNWDAKDVAQDRFVEASNGRAEVWLIQGDPTIYTSLSAAQGGLKPRFESAFLDGNNVIYASYRTFTTPLQLTGGSSGFTVTDTTTNQTVPVTSAEYVDQNGSKVIKLTLAAAPNVSHSLSVGLGPASMAVTPRMVLNSSQYNYSGNDLGATWTAPATTFRLWAPTASSIQLNIFKNDNGDLYKAIAMKRSVHGTWVATVKHNLNGFDYNYGVNHQGTIGIAVDPYARNISPNGKYGKIVDLAATNPTGWKSDHFVTLKHPEDAVIYEVHVRDFSIDRNSGVKHRGKYLAFTETNTHGPGGVKTGVASLKELGITHVELLPTQGCASVDEVKAESTQPAPASSTAYNWCYDPRNFNVPNAAYATKATGTTRIVEFKQMVQALHRQGLGVILDVVYNHTSAVGSSDFDQIIPGYYYRTDAQGNYTNGSGVGNEVAAERPMVRKFILDSVRYWVQQYHVDGFRFDEMALLGKTTVTAIEKGVRAINRNAVLLGEPWAGGTSGIVGDQLFTKGIQQGSRVAVFNDNIRDAVGGNVGTATAQGYATGDPTNYTNLIPTIPASISYSGSVHAFTAQPDETINYVSCHDNYNLWDHINLSNPNASPADKIKMDELAQTIVFTSQGIPYMQGGEEFLRTKGGSGNSYNAGDAVNQLDWSLKSKNRSVFGYYAALIHLRRDHPAFRMTSASMIQQHLIFLAAPTNVVHYELTGNANGDTWQNIDVIFNPTSTVETVTLPSGSWTEVADSGRIGETSLGTATGTVAVQPLTAEILYGGDVGTAVDPIAANGGKPVTVTFRVLVPSNNPPGDKVYIAGSIPQLGPWDPGIRPMQNAGNGVWTVSVQIAGGTKLQYKYTRGSWATVESWGTITGLANRTVSITAGADGTQTINDTATDWGKPGPDDHRGVQKWADLPLP